MEIIIPLVALIISVVLHELMHGVVGNRLGDPTPRMLGRLTLNPIKHMDLVGSVLLPGALILLSQFTGGGFIFGWAKPVPINPIHFEDPRKDMALVALAGPLTNIALALTAALVLKGIIQSGTLLTIIGQTSAFGVFAGFLYYSVYINLVLAFLNLIPIPPLDGSKILEAFLPEHIAAAYESISRYGIFLLLILLFVFDIGVYLQQIVSFFLSILGLPTL